MPNISKTMWLAIVTAVVVILNGVTGEIPDKYVFAVVALIQGLQYVQRYLKGDVTLLGKIKE